jgi:hypothetical protein
MPKLHRIMKWAVIAPILWMARLCMGMVGRSLAWWRIQNRERVHMKPFVTDTGETNGDRGRAVVGTLQRTGGYGQDEEKKDYVSSAMQGGGVNEHTDERAGRPSQNDHD